MTGRTHDLAALTALTLTVALYPVPKITLATALVAFAANMIGGLSPDIDQSTSSMWNNARGGHFLGKLASPLLGGHRYISHSLIGIFIFGFVTKVLLSWTQSFLIVDVNIVWTAYMVGYVSHLFMDTFTQEGVPWFFPIPIRFGIPPIRVLRPKTGGIIEKSFIFPMLIFINFYLFYSHYQKFLDFIKHSIIK